MALHQRRTQAWQYGILWQLTFAEVHTWIKVQNLQYVWNPLKTRFIFLFIFYFLHFFTVDRNDLVPQMLLLYRNTRYFRPVPTVSENKKYHCQKIMHAFKSWSKVGKSAWWHADNLNQHILPSRSTPVWERTLLEICIFWASSPYLPWYQICGCLHGTFLSNKTISICLPSLLLSCFITMKFTGTVYLWEHKPSATFNYFWLKLGDSNRQKNRILPPSSFPSWNGRNEELVHHAFLFYGSQQILSPQNKEKQQYCIYLIRLLDISNYLQRSYNFFIYDHYYTLQTVSSDIYSIMGLIQNPLMHLANSYWFELISEGLNALQSCT